MSIGMLIGLAVVFFLAGGLAVIIGAVLYLEMKKKPDEPSKEEWKEPHV